MQAGKSFPNRVESNQDWSVITFFQLIRTKWDPIWCQFDLKISDWLDYTREKVSPRVGDDKFSAQIELRKPDRRKLHPLSDSLTSLGIMGAQIKIILKPFNTILMWWSEGFQGCRETPVSRASMHVWSRLTFWSGSEGPSYRSVAFAWFPTLFYGRNIFRYIPVQCDANIQLQHPLEFIIIFFFYG